jgi:signal transduction histidine kinase
MTVLRSLAQPLPAADEPATLLEDIATRIRQALRPTRYLIWLFRDAGECDQPDVAWLGVRPPSDVRCLRPSAQPAKPGVRPVDRLADGPFQAACVEAGMSLVVPLLAQREVAGWLGVGSPKHERAYPPEICYFLEVLADRVAAHLHTERLRQRLDRSVWELRRAYRQIIEAQEQERCLLAGLLHDETLQHLADLSVRLGLLRSRPETDPAGLVDLQQRVARTDRRLREIVRGVHPAILTDLGLVEAVIAFLETVALQPQGPLPRITLTIEGFGEARLPEAGLELALYRVAQNAVTNALKHGQPSQLDLHLDWGDKVVELRVQDDGFGTEMTIEAAARAGHFGLLTMRERIEAFGGTFALHSERGSGVRVVAVVLVSLPTPAPRQIERYVIDLAESSTR